MATMRLGASPKVPNSHVTAISIILFVFLFLLLLALKRKPHRSIFVFLIFLNPPIVNVLSFVSLILLLSHSYLPTHPLSLTH